MKEWNSKSENYNKKKVIEGIKKKEKKNKYLRNRRKKKIGNSVKNIDLRQQNNKKRKFDTKFDFPEDFRIFENYDEVVTLFNNILKKLIEGVQVHSELKQFNVEFNLSRIKKISNPTIIYLLALMNSFKNLGNRDILFHGNCSKYENVNKTLEDSGFYNYCDSSSLDLKRTKGRSEKIQIKFGNRKYNPQEFKDVYVLLSNKKNKLRYLSTVLIEILGNSVEHAYEISNVFKGKEWYFFCEEKKHFYSFILLDTGVGIAKTVQKNFREKIFNVFRMNKNYESNLVKSAFLGEFRTGTKEKNRGNGMPKVFENCTKGNLRDMEILSSKAHCQILKNGEVICMDNEKALRGTMYRWKIYKEDLY